MFHEYAVDPAVLSSWQTARYLLDAFGPWKGRFLAEYPARWRRMVYQGLRCPDVEKKRIEQKLAQMDQRVFIRRPGAAYDPERPWLDNAITQHQAREFRAILARETRGLDFVLDVDQMDEGHPRWSVEQGRLLPREPVLFAQAVDVLFRASSHVILVDPYFRADQADKTAPVTAFCNLLRGRTVTVEIHGSDKDLASALLAQHATRYLPGSVPAGMKVTLRCWTEKPGGARLHNRYLLTDVGGLQFGDSIEQGDRGQHDRVSILEETTRARLWADYAGTPAAFDEAGPPSDIHGRRR